MKPMNDCSLVGESGVGWSCRAWILAGSGHMPFAINTAP